MRFSIFLFIIILICSSTNNELIKGEIVSKNYIYNKNGFINSPFGKVNVTTHSFYTNQKLTKVLSNHSEGFLEYSLVDLRQDTLLLKYFAIDTLYNLNKIKLKEKVIRNDTVFYKLEKSSVLINIEK